jgi:hypothetical protein
MIEPTLPLDLPVLDPQPRAVFTHGGEGADHGGATHRVVAERVAALLGLPFGGPCEDGTGVASSYLVPRAPLCGPLAALRYGIGGEHDLLGSWVHEAWMATKAIVHPLASAEAMAPAGWPHLLAGEALPLTLRGVTAFCAADALTAGRALLQTGPVRLKPAGADGGRAQIVARDAAALEAGIASLCVAGALADIVVVEEDLEDVTTYSVGQVRLPGRAISYWGTQSLTPDNRGGQAYGGSSLFVVQGGFDALLARSMPAECREAVERAVAFDRLADRHLAGLIASRRNYDVACGNGPGGDRRIGVLEQSWRVGGATPAEIAALEAFADRPGLSAVRARCVEIHGPSPFVPEGATVYYRGDDPEMGPLTKYACVDETIEG